MRKWGILLLCVALALLCVGAVAEPLKKGDKGDDVKELQLKLIEHNYLLDGADGQCGGKTEKAIKQIQEEAGLEQTGVADDDTLAYLEEHSAAFEAKKDADVLMYKVEVDPTVHLLKVHVKNTGRQRITGYKFKLYQCNDRKTSLGTFYGKKNSKKYEYWTEHSVETSIASGENDTAMMMLAEGWKAEFSDGTSETVTYLDNGTQARVVLSQYTTEDGKKHNVSQKLYAAFR